MKERETPRSIPENRRNYFKLDLGEQGEHWFRTPFPILVLEVLGLMEQKGLYQFSKRDDGKIPDQGTMARTRSLWELGAAALGLCWHHINLDLDAKLSEHEHDDATDYCAYGRAVLEELHDRDYDPSDLMDAFPVLLGQLARSVVGAKKVESREDFSEAQPGSSTS